MVALRAKVTAFADAEDGATAIEYGLIAALIAVACIAAIGVFGNSLFGMFNYVDERAGNAMSGANV